MPLNLLSSYYNSEIYKSRVADQEEKKAITLPRLAKRKRAISISGKNIKTTVQQQQSPFFKLPGELRTQIYDAFFEKREGIHVVCWEGRLHAYQCQWSLDLAVPTRHTQCWNQYCNESWSETSKSGYSGFRSGAMALLTSCRIM